MLENVIENLCRKVNAILCKNMIPAFVEIFAASLDTYLDEDVVVIMRFGTQVELDRMRGIYIRRISLLFISCIVDEEKMLVIFITTLVLQLLFILKCPGTIL